ncbi:peroxiredoxin [Specibacter cremeus]|uniref:peroxiredoxin n=1 Tax=Specibacter cremeus TaxID=1629051 RepID=UPI000F780B3A|nr:peroxiredoxin [Specibacter cremeus]
MDDGGTRVALRAGDVAPDFTLPNQFGEAIRLSALRGGPVVVVFYPFAFSGICTGELCDLRDNVGLFKTAKARLLAVSVDSKYTLRAYARDEGYEFDLLADFWPHGDVARSYGVFDEVAGMAGRGTFVVGADGVLVDTFGTPAGQARSLERYRHALAAL